MFSDKTLKQGVSKLYLQIENACETSVVLFCVFSSKNACDLTYLYTLYPILI